MGASPIIAPPQPALSPAAKKTRRPTINRSPAIPKIPPNPANPASDNRHTKIWEAPLFKFPSFPKFIPCSKLSAAKAPYNPATSASPASPSCTTKRTAKSRTSPCVNAYPLLASGLTVSVPQSATNHGKPCALAYGNSAAPARRNRARTVRPIGHLATDGAARLHPALATSAVRSNMSCWWEIFGVHQILEGSPTGLMPPQCRCGQSHSL